ncbi:TetR/AcrR family transcriptional regulator C-terminal domain-containing protein [Streptomyces microflavus]|uniref:TetR/AcrR family transcriptional regulator C-terminal domain-containing protein n=1 Tax=Streptomyces microflavus TaxID=1919 RepID=UPI0033C71244
MQALRPLASALRSLPAAGSHRLAGIGVLEVTDASLAVDHFLLLTSGAVSERSHYGAAALSAPARAEIVTAGVRAFLHGYLPRPAPEPPH